MTCKYFIWEIWKLFLMELIQWNELWGTNFGGVLFCVQTYQHAGVCRLACLSVWVMCLVQFWGHFLIFVGMVLLIDRFWWLPWILFSFNYRLIISVNIVNSKWVVAWLGSGVGSGCGPGTSRSVYTKHDIAARLTLKMGYQEINRVVHHH